ncbi:hypothetical protein F0562_035718 [Nyssa sinensis]|uniref:NAB domain-containing protein n=1 Tax=Nyssa sinensis TaxID=561372 RepID=A0A5J5ABR8_9ASTE|nr:hypothetical protein F0562_035718 [Nyssa sinensis]
MLHRAARNAYSWWWASHIRTKQSKWLEHNLEDMEEKVEYILKIIDEDEDSFAKRAEMYYKKRPELLHFVEDSFRGYRALAARYDHLSKELQSANRTIATVFPEQVQLSLDDEDEKNFQTTSNPSHNPRRPSKNLPAVPKLSIPKIPQFSQKKSRSPSRLMSKRGIPKTNVPAAAAASSSGMSKLEATAEIDKLQKRILAFQTEKEFIKSSYESGLSKYWEIENQVTELQEKVSGLQHDFGIGTVIEDDEARSLMAAAALQACQETLLRLQEKQEQLTEEARVEYQRIKETHVKFETLKGQFSNHMSSQDLPEKYKSTSRSLEFKNLDQQIDSMEQERRDLELVRAKIKEQLQLNSSTSLTMSELAENIDELVDKVIALETAVSSQTALVKRIKSERNELQAHLHGLDEDREVLIEGSDDKNNKIRELEQELFSVQDLNQTVKDQNKDLQIHFTEASVNIDHLSEKLKSVKPDEEVQNMVLCQEVRAVPGDNPEKKLQDVRTEKEGEKVVVLKQSTSVKAEEKNFVQSNPSNHVVDLPRKGQVRAVPHATPEQFKGNENMMAPGHDSGISKEVRNGEEEKEDDIPDNSTSVKAEEENFVQSNLSNHLDDLLVKGQVIFVPDATSEIGFKENENKIASGNFSVITDVRMEEEEKKDNVLDQSSSVKAAEENFVQFDLINHLDDLSVKGQVRAVWDDNLEKELRKHEDTMAPGRDSVIKEDVQENKGDFLDLNPVKAEEEENFVMSNLCDRLDDLSAEGQTRAVLDANPKEGSKELADKMVPGHPVILEDTKTEEEKKDVIPGHSAEEVNFVQSNPSNHSDDLSRSQPRAALDANQEQRFKEQEEMKAPGDGSMISTDMKMEEEIDDFLDHRSAKAAFVLSNQGNHPNYLLGNDQEPKKQEENKKQGLFRTEDNHFYMKTQEMETEDVDQPNWRQMVINGIDDRDKILMEEYTSILRNYKDVKNKLSEVEKKNRDSLFKSALQIKELKNANALKDAEIQSLHKKLNLLQADSDDTPETNLTEFVHSQQEGPHENLATTASSQVCDISSPTSDQKHVPNLLDEENVESIERTEESAAPENAKNSPTKEDEEKVISNQDHHAISTIEEKFRMDIDGLLEENIEFWLRFSTSFHQMQKFQTSVQDLQEELRELKENKKQEGSSKRQSVNSELRPIYKHLREIKTELALWLEHNALLSDGLQNRLLSLGNIQEEISRLSDAGSVVEETKLNAYQAAKFQGEVLNMKLENKKIANELQAGLECAKKLQVEIETTLSDLEEELGIAGSKSQHSHTKNSSIRSRIPLRSFLFGVKLRKQRPSLFACMSPTLQKQFSDLSAVPPQ